MSASHTPVPLLTVNELNFESEVLHSDVPVFVDVSARWCAPCKVAAPLVAALAERHRGALKVVLIDGEESPELVARLGVRGFPTFVAFSGGVVLETLAGFRGAKPLDAMAARLLEARAS